MKRLLLMSLSCLLIVCLAGASLAEKPTLVEDKKSTSVQKITPQSEKPQSTGRTSTPQSTPPVVEPAVPDLQAANEAAAYDIPWQSINAGGDDISSTNYQMMFSVGQSVIGYATSTNYEAGIGYWYGMGTTGECDCGDQTGTDPNAVGDVDCSGNTDPLDVQFLVQFVYTGNDARCAKPACPYECGDVNCNENVDPLDIQFLVNFVYKSLDAMCDPC